MPRIEATSLGLISLPHEFRTKSGMMVVAGLVDAGDGVRMLWEVAESGGKEVRVRRGTAAVW
jgi:hypothetical protein